MLLDDINAVEDYTVNENPSEFRRWAFSVVAAIKKCLLSEYAGEAVAVADLPSAAVAGQKRFVNDATATTFYSIVAGGGAFFAPVFSDGTNWRIG